MQRAIPAVFMRGGTSKALFFQSRVLPLIEADGDREPWNRIFRAALGSPDPDGRQLDGMGGGATSLSKIAIIGPPTRPDADIDYTFAQIGIRDDAVSYRANCGNISSAVGPYCVDEGLVSAPDGIADVRIHNTNTGKLILANFAVRDGRAVTQGEHHLPGVSGLGAPIRLAFTDPGGAATGRLLPTGNARDRIDIEGHGAFEVSLVDACNLTLFIDAASLGLTGIEMPDALAADGRLVDRLERLRIAGALLCGIVRTREEAERHARNLPFIAIVSPPADSVTLAGGIQEGSRMDITTRMISSGQPHKATPLTAGMCLAVAARIPGTIPFALARHHGPDADMVIGHPGGALQVAARVRLDGPGPVAEQAIVYRTARRLMEGNVLVPAEAFAD